jgi:hypothetical protein
MEVIGMNESTDIKCCDKCGIVLNRNSWVAVTRTGRVYCYEANCNDNILENERVAYIGFASGIFCGKCGKTVSGGRRKPDVSGKVFCNEDCKKTFYENVCTCKKCRCELR